MQIVELNLFGIENYVWCVELLARQNENEHEEKKQVNGYAVHTQHVKLASLSSFEQ